MTLHPPKKPATPLQRHRDQSWRLVKLAYVMFLPQDEGLDIYVKENTEQGKHYFMCPLLGL